MRNIAHRKNEWAQFSRRREFFEEIAKDKGCSSDDVNMWYSINSADIFSKKVINNLIFANRKNSVTNRKVCLITMRTYIIFTYNFRHFIFLIITNIVSFAVTKRQFLLMLSVTNFGYLLQN